MLTKITFYLQTLPAEQSVVDVMVKSNGEEKTYTKTVPIDKVVGIKKAVLELIDKL